MPSKPTSPKRGPKRKSRRARLSVFAGSYDDKYPLGELNWGSAESWRAPITGIIRQYLRDASVERDAPFLDDVQEYLERVASQAKGLLAALTQLSGDGERHGASAVRALIEMHFQGIHFPKRHPVNAFVLEVTELLAACGKAKDELAGLADGGFKEGDAWNQMIRNLDAFAKDRGLPTAASKGSDKEHFKEPSVFVALVRVLQNTLPENVRRHTASDAALAAAISIARRETRRTGP